MADATSNVEIIFQAIDRAEGVLENLRTQLQGLTSEQNRVATSAGSLTSAQGRLEGALAQTNLSTKQVLATFSQMPGSVGAAAGSLSTFESAIAAVTSTAGLMVLGVAAGAAAVAVLGKATVDASVALADHVKHVEVLGLQTGLTSRETEEFDAALKNMGLSVESLTPSFRFLNDNIIKALQGNEKAKQAFQELGISVDDLRNKTSGEIFAAAIKGLGTIESQAARTQIAVDLLGRGALAVLPLAGSAFEAAAVQAERVGLVLSDSEKRIGESIETSKNAIDRSQEGMKAQAGVLASILVDPFLKMEAAAAQSTAETLHSMTILATQGKTVMDDLAKAAKNSVETVADSILKKVGTTAADVGAMALNYLHIPKITIIPPPPPPEGTHAMGPFASDADKEAMAAAQATADAIKDQYTTTLAVIALDRERIEWGALTTAEEIKALESMEKQVLSKGELLAIQKELNAIEIGTSDRPYGPPAPFRAGLEIAASTSFGAPPPAVGQGMLKPVDTGRVVAQAPNSQEIVAPSTAEIAKSIDDLTGDVAKFLAQFKDFPEILAAAGDGTTAASQAMIGFIGELKLGQGSVLEFGRQMATTVRQGLQNFVHEAITGTQDILKAFGDMIASITEQLIEKAFVTTIIGLIPGVGPAAAAAVHQTGGTFLMAQGGGSLTARSGVNLSGVRGFDTVPGAWGAGETILSHGLTDQVARMADAFLSDRTHGSAPAGSNSEVHHHQNNVELHIHTPFVDMIGLQNFVTERLGPMVVDTINRGSFRAR